MGQILLKCVQSFYWLVVKLNTVAKFIKPALINPPLANSSKCCSSAPALVAHVFALILKFF